MKWNKVLKSDRELRAAVDKLSESYGFDEEETERLYETFERKDRSPMYGDVEIEADCMRASDPPE